MPVIPATVQAWRLGLEARFALVGAAFNFVLVCPLTRLLPPSYSFCPFSVMCVCVCVCVCKKDESEAGGLGALFIVSNLTYRDENVCSGHIAELRGVS